jgi:hypothetical protein
MFDAALIEESRVVARISVTERALRRGCREEGGFGLQRGVTVGSRSRWVSVRA